MKYKVKLCKDLVDGDKIVYNATIQVVKQYLQCSGASCDFGEYGLIHFYGDGKPCNRWFYENLPIVCVDE